MSIDMSQFHQVFFEESEEHLAAMESLLLELDIAQPDGEQLNAIFRAAHSIKGSSGTFGFTDLAEVTHILETLLDRLRKHETALRADMVDAFLAAGDVLKSMLAGHRGGAPADPQTVAAVCARLRQLTDDAASAPPILAPITPTQAADANELRTYDIEFVPTLHAADDPAILPRLLDELRTYGDLAVVARPADGSTGAAFWHVRLRTAEAPAVFSEAVDFVSEHDAWRVREVTGAPGGDEGHACALSGSAAESVEDDSFGLFADAPGSVPSTAAGGEGEGDAYGFFDTALLPDPALPPVTPSEFAVEGDGFGFFEALPETTPATPEPLAAADTEADESYGFFAPLPAVASEPAPVLAPTPAPPPIATVVAEPVVEPAALPVAPADAPKRAAKAGAAAASESASIRVGVEKVDQLINLVGELVITQAMLLQCAEHMQDAAPERLRQGLTQLERNTRDLQESVMSIRMLPISFVFSRFPRVVHDLSARLGKQVELKLHGEATELDKGLIERIADPLTHLIRNSLDHGIELPEIRAAAGKNPVGTITLRAAHQGGNIVIEVGDDGAGLNRQRILAKARERGFQVNDQMSDAEVWALIFEAGFSTADEVTDVSGRGVGMDVVRKNIQSLGGRVEIESLTGAGTRMTVRLPLTLAILDGMSVAVGSQTYILPLSSVVESLQPLAEDVKTLANQTRVIRVRGDYLPVIVLHEIFNISPLASCFTQGIMVILDADGTKAALFIDALVGQHQVVIKSLENNYRRVAGVSGATIMGDGHVALILDIPALIGLAKTAQLAA